MKRCLIIVGGDYAPIGPVEKDDFVLACDRGYAWCAREGIVPDLILGDFDSYPGALPKKIPVLRYPVEKDDTDAMLAVRWAHEQGFDAVRLCCAFGGRLDHLLSNVETLHYAAALGMETEAADENNMIRILRPGAHRVPCQPRRSLSLIALTERVTGLTIRGAKYEVENAVLRKPTTLGQSNAFVTDVKLSFESGMLALVCCRLED
jgi:thiamine pyrophosphokinase